MYYFAKKPSLVRIVAMTTRNFRIQFNQSVPIAIFCFNTTNTQYNIGLTAIAFSINTMGQLTSIGDP